MTKMGTTDKEEPGPPPKPCLTLILQGLEDGTMTPEDVKEMRAIYEEEYRKYEEEHAAWQCRQRRRSSK